MKQRNSILFAIVVVLIAANSAFAVPAKPIDATPITLLSAEGTPEELRNMVVSFGKRIMEVNTSAETKREQLQKQMKEGLEKAILKAQSSGDIDSVLAIKAAKEKFDTMETSDVPIVKNALVFREKKTAEIETARVADAMKVAKDFNDELDKAKKDETTKGNFEAAKAISDHQKKLITWVQSLRESAPVTNSTQQDRQAPMDIRPQSAQSVQTSSTGEQMSPQPRKSVKKVVSVNANSAEGSTIGFIKSGDTIHIRYLSGKWTSDTKNVPRSNPDVDDWGPWGGMQTVLSKDPGSELVASIPKNTATDPFEFTIEDAAKYRIRIKDQGTWDNAGTVQYEVEIVSALNN